MLYKATKSFAGKVTMYRGEEKKLDAATAAPLLECGYITPAAEQPAPEQAEEAEQSEDTEQPEDTEKETKRSKKK